MACIVSNNEQLLIFPSMNSRAFLTRNPNYRRKTPCESSCVKFNANLA